MSDEIGIEEQMLITMTRITYWEWAIITKKVSGRDVELTREVIRLLKEQLAEDIGIFRRKFLT